MEGRNLRPILFCPPLVRLRPVCVKGQLPYKAENILMQATIVCGQRRHPRWDFFGKQKRSLGARWFCQQLLSKDEMVRPSALEASRNEWVVQLKALHPEPPAEFNCGNLQQQHLSSHLMQMALHCAVSQLSLSEMHHLNQRFKYYDSSGDGRLGHVEIHQVLRNG